MTRAKGEEARLLAERSIFKSIQVALSKIADISDAWLDEWIQHIRTALKDGGRGVSQRTLHQFVGKIVVKNETGTLDFTFPLEAKLYMLGLQDLDLRGRVPYTRQRHRFDVPVTPSTSSNSLHPNKPQLHATILAMRAAGLSYRQIGTVLGIHWTRVGQILKLERHELI